MFIWSIFIQKYNGLKKVAYLLAAQLMSVSGFKTDIT